MLARAKPRIDSSRLYIESATPGLLNSNTSRTTGSPPSAGANVIVSLPAPGTLKSVARYWSPKAWRPMTIGCVQAGTRRGTLRQMIGSRKIVPSSSLRIVPFGERYIAFRPNSLTRASSGVIVAHFTPTPYCLIARAASSVTLSSVSSRCWTLRS